MKKIAIIGHFMFNDEKNSVNGQSIKTRNYFKILENKYGKENIYVMDSNYFRKKIVKNYITIFKLCKNCDSIIILPTANGLKLMVPFFWLMKKMFSFTLIYSVIGGWLSDFLTNNQWILMYMKSIDYILPESNKMVQNLENKFGLQNTMKVSNILMPSDYDSLCIDKDEKFTSPFRLCTFSRVTKEKGISDAIEVIKKINEHKDVKCSLDIYGPLDDNYSSEFYSLINNCDEINYKGTLQKNEVINVLREYYLMLFPTYYYGEGMPGAVLEALYAGVPIVASDWHDNSEIIKNNFNGVIYSLDDKIGNLEQNVLYLLNNTNLVKKMSINCKKDSLNYLPENALIKVFDIIERTI